MNSERHATKFNGNFLAVLEAKYAEITEPSSCDNFMNVIKTYKKQDIDLRIPQHFIKFQKLLLCKKNFIFVSQYAKT